MVTLVTYLGELFCYEITTSKVIFDVRTGWILILVFATTIPNCWIVICVFHLFTFQVLYGLISIGVTNNYHLRSFSDPPDSGFRVRLACTLLKSVGDYFFSGNPFVSTKLKYFLKYLQVEDYCTPKSKGKGCSQPI